VPCSAIASSYSGQYVTIVANTNNNLVTTTSDSGSTWSTVAQLSYMYFATVAMSSTGQIQAVGSGISNGIWLSTDYGVSWSRTSGPSSSYYLSMDSTGSNIVSAQYATMYYSTNTGNSWTATVSPSFELFSGTAISGNSVYLVGAFNIGGIFYQENLFPIPSSGGSSGSSSSSGLSGGAIAGIVIAILALFAAGIGFFLYQTGKCASKKPLSNQSASLDGKV
jgi:hypothetical protein